MSQLLKQPAVWPMLALNPEPSMDPDDPIRTFLEWFGPCPQTVQQTVLKPEPAPRLDLHFQRGYRPSPHLHQPAKGRG